MLVLISIFIVYLISIFGLYAIGAYGNKKNGLSTDGMLLASFEICTFAWCAVACVLLLIGAAIEIFS